MVNRLPADPEITSHVSHALNPVLAFANARIAINGIGNATTNAVRSLLVDMDLSPAAVKGMIVKEGHKMHVSNDKLNAALNLVDEVAEPTDGDESIETVNEAVA